MSVVMETIGHDPLASHPKSPGLSALMAACQRNDDAEVRMLLQKRHHLVATRDRNGKTALHYCTENRDLTCADLILKSEPSLLNEQDEEGYTALHLAVINGNELMTKYLIHKGADVNIVDSEMHSCIHWATVCGELECLDILIDAGGNPATPDIHGAYPIHYASQMCGPNSEMGNNMELGFAVLSKLLARGVSVLVRDQDGRQPLLWAASAGSSDAIVALVNAGAVVTGEDKDGLTALHCAASRGHVDCVETLISLCGAEVETIDKNGCTALFYAVTLGHADCTQLLLQHGAQPNRQDRKGRTAAHCGASKGQLETLKILRSNGGNLWLTNVRGDLPLHEAVQSGRKDLVLWLLSLNPDAVNAQNLNGRTALHIAALTDNVEMCKILLDSRANINAILRTSKGQLMTPLDATIRRGNKSCAKYLQLHGALPASRLLENHELSRSFIGRLEEAPGQRITPSEESLSSPFVNKMNPYSLESSFDEKRMRSESVQTDESKIDTQDADVQVLSYTPRLQTDENVTKSKDIERQYYLKESIEKTSTSKDDGKEHRMRQAIITNVYITASDDNKKGRKGRNRQESEEDEASDEDSVADSHIGRKKRRSPRRKNVYRDDVDSDDIQEYENNESVVRRTTKKSRRNKSYKQRIVHIDEDEANTGQIAEQTDKRSHKDRKGRQIRATSENDEDENKSESEERDTQRKKRHVQNRKGYSEEEESLEDDYDDESRKMSKIKIKKYYEINEKNKATEIKDGTENNHITSKRKNIVLKTKQEDNERNTKYNIHKETEEKNNRQKEPNKDNDAKESSRQNEQNNNETGTHVKTDINKSDKDELEETNILETGNHTKNDFKENDTDGFEETNIPETGNHDKTDFNKNVTGKLEETNILETGKRFKDQILNEHKTVNSQTSPLEEEENHKLVGMTETSSKITNKFTTDTEKSGFLRNSKSELILVNSKVLPTTDETIPLETSNKTADENFSISAKQRLTKHKEKQQQADSVVNPTAEEGEKDELVQGREERGKAIQRKEESIDDEGLSEDEVQTIDAKENPNAKKARYTFKTKKRNSLLLTEEEHDPFSTIQSPDKMNTNDSRKSKSLNNDKRHCSDTPDVSSVGEEGYKEEMGNIRMKKLSVNFKDKGAEKDYSVAQPSSEYKIVNGQTFVRPKDRKVNVAHVKSKLDTKAPVSRSKRSSVGLPKVKPNQQRALHNNNSIKDDVIDEAMQKSIKMNQVEKRLFEDLEEMKKQQQRHGRRNEAVIVQRLANKLRKDVVVAGLREFEGPYNYKNYEKYIFEQIRLLSNQGKIPQIKKNNPVTEGHGRRPAKPFFPKPNVPGKSVLPAISPPSSGGTTASETNTTSKNRSNYIYRSSKKSTIRSELNQNIGSTVAAPSGVKKRESMNNDELRLKTNVNESNLKQYKQVNNENRPVSHKDTASNVIRNDVSLGNLHLKKAEYGFQNSKSLEEEGETGKNFDLQGNIITSNGKTDDTVTTEVTESRYRVTTDLVTGYNGQLRDVSGEKNESEQDDGSDIKQEILSSSGKGETNNKDKKSVNESVHRVMSASLQNGAQPSDTVTVEVSSEGSATKYTHTTTVEDLLRATIPRTDDESQKRSLKLEDMLDLENDGPLTFEIRHGREKNVFKLPADKLQNNKKWQVTFTIGKEEHRPVC